MRQRLITLMAGVAIAAPALAAAQAPRVHVDIPDVVVQQQRSRPQPRVLIQGRDGRDGREEQSETFKKVVRLGASGELDISNIAGDIVFTRGGGNDATIEVTKVARGRTVEEARETLPLVRVDISERGSRVEVRTVYPGNEQWSGPGRERNVGRRGINVSVHYAIMAPAGTRVTAQSVSGNLRATDIAGEISFVTVSGNVHVTKGRRLATAKSISGAVEITDSDSDSRLEVNSVSGNIVMRQVKTPGLELGTVSGNVTLTNVECPRLEAQSLSGDVEFSGAFTKGGRYELNSHSGNVRLSIAGGTGFEVEATSWSGNIQSDLPLSGQRQDPGDGRGRRNRTIRGVFGDGSAVLEITTFSGGVFIGKR
jgi:DUF4097 and DUF4098 domain-containing protein YvlB